MDVLIRFLRFLFSPFIPQAAWALKVNQGFDAEVVGMFGDTTAPPVAGTSTGTSATTMTDSGATWTTNAFKWHLVQCGNRVGVVQSNTGTALTIDRWYDVSALGATSAASTPSATSAYLILPTGSPCAFVGLTTTGSFTPASGDTTLSAEITTAGGGLIRKLGVVAHSAGTSTCTITAVFTANGSDSLPAVTTGIGITGSMVAAKGPLLYEDAFSASATLAAVSDNVTCVDTITL